MPVNVVRTPEDEIAWERAKAAARKQYPYASGAHFYRIVDVDFQENDQSRRESSAALQVKRRITMDEKSFVREVAKRVDCDERRAETLIFAVFQELRDRLTPHEAADVAAQLPFSLKMLWKSFDRPDRRVRRVHESRFLYEVAQMAGLEDHREAEGAVTAVFTVLKEALSSPTGTEGEAWHVMSQLPTDLKRLWMRAGEIAGE